MRTTIYIDGFNLYYNALKNSPYKWLDLKTLCRSVLSQHNQITQIKYFTAYVSDRSNNSGSAARQKIYLSALRKHIPELEITTGHFSVHSKIAPLVTPGGALDNPEVSGKGRQLCTCNQKIFTQTKRWKKDPGPKVHVINTEEKGSDVNLAVHIVNDAWKDTYDCCVIISNDSDLAEALRIAKDERGKTVGLINTWKQRPVGKLKRHASFIRTARESAFASAQLPTPIPNTKYYKPESW